MLASYYAQLQIMPLCNPFTESTLRNSVGIWLLKKDNSDYKNIEQWLSSFQLLKSSMKM